MIITFSAQYRFFIDVYLIAIFLLIKNLSEQKTVFTAFFLSVFISVIFMFPGFVQKFRVGKQMKEFSFSQLIKPQLPSTFNIYSKYEIGNFNFTVPKYPLEKKVFPSLNIYDLKLYYYYGIFPQCFGKDYKNGFFQRKLTETEKKELKNIISETEKLKP